MMRRNHHMRIGIRHIIALMVKDKTLTATSCGWKLNNKISVLVLIFMINVLPDKD